MLRSESMQLPRLVGSSMRSSQNVEIVERFAGRNRTGRTAANHNKLIILRILN